MQLATIQRLAVVVAALAFASANAAPQEAVKGQALVHTREGAAPATAIGVPQSVAKASDTNPYIKHTPSASEAASGVVGVALSVNNEDAAESSSSSAWTTPVAIGGCAVAAVGIAGFVVARKRKQAAAAVAAAGAEGDEEEEMTTNTPARRGEEEVDYGTEMVTPMQMA